MALQIAEETPVYKSRVSFDLRTNFTEYHCGYTDLLKAVKTLKQRLSIHTWDGRSTLSPALGAVFTVKDTSFLISESISRDPACLR